MISLNFCMSPVIQYTVAKGVAVGVSGSTNIRDRWEVCGPSVRVQIPLHKDRKQLT